MDNPDEVQTGVGEFKFQPSDQLRRMPIFQATSSIRSGPPCRLLVKSQAEMRTVRTSAG